MDEFIEYYSKLNCEHCGKKCPTNRIYDLNVSEINTPTKVKNIRWHCFCDECYSIVEKSINDLIRFPRTDDKEIMVDSYKIPLK